MRLFETPLILFPEEGVVSNRGIETVALLDRVVRGRAAVDELVGVLYDELRGLARRQLRGEGRTATLVPTELVQEAYLRLVDQQRVRSDERTQFLAAAGVAMRRVLVDRARARRALKRDGGHERVELTEGLVRDEPGAFDVLDLEEELGELHRIDPLRARIAELKLFSELEHADIAWVLEREGQATHSAKVGRHWRAARAWLAQRLEKGSREAR